MGARLSNNRHPLHPQELEATATAKIPSAFPCNYKKLEFLQFPQKVRCLIYILLDNYTKTLMRLTCRQVKQEIDQMAGLHVYIDTRITGNIEFVCKTKVNSAIILALDEAFSPTAREISLLRDTENNNPSELSPLLPNLQKLTNYATLSNTALLKNLLIPSTETLQYLHLAGSSLTASDLGKGQEDVELELPRLAVLAIEYEVDTASAALENLISNLKFLLRAFKCSSLKTFNLEPSVFPEALSSQTKQRIDVHWEQQLKQFIHAHRDTLENLCIYFHDEMDDKDDNFKCPKSLRHYTIRCALSVPGSPALENCYWKRILEQQQQLHSFVIRAELWHDLGGAFKMLKKLIDENRSTLEDICVGSLWRETNVCSTFDFRVDLSVFKPCLQLTYLDLYADSGSCPKANGLQTLGRNLNSLPMSLRTLKVAGILLQSDELLSLEFHPKLYKVSFTDVGISGIFGINFKVLVAILRNNSVQKCMISGFNMEQDGFQLEKFVKDRNDGRFSSDIIICKRSYAIRKAQLPAVDMKRSIVNEKRQNKRRCLAF